MLDPACGDGVFLSAARALGAQARGWDVDPASARAAGAACGDFFDHLDGAYDAVVGNPPYVHFTQTRSWRKARAAAARRGVPLGSGASAWAAFVAASADLVRPEGRMAMVVPREALFVDYARALLELLKRRFGRVELVGIRDFLFEGALEKVAVLACAPGPRRFRIREVDTVGEVTPEFLDREAPGGESIAWSRVPAGCRDAARRALDRLVPLAEVADVSVGVVTGDKEYFLVHGLPSRPVVASPTWLRGALVTPADLRGRPRLLDVAADYRGGDPAVDAHLAEGRRRGVPSRYKCAERACWWRPRMGEPPDAFLTYLNDRLPRLAANPARALCTNNLHRVVFRRPVPVGTFYNPATLLSAELGGRILGDGALKLEPGDASRLRVVASGRDPLQAVDRALRAGDEARAIRIAGDASGLSGRLLRACTKAHATLRDLRLGERLQRLGYSRVS